MNDGNAKQQIVEKIKNSTNILVTVSSDPSVDELSAALGLTLLLNKMNKHATAVFSGAIPPAITFLDPQKTFENTVSSLQDFIIALDKEKADHLRYKVEGEVVKIFITPYRTTITNDDLEFSQGDYNVELVLALGVKKRDNLDKALEAHGRILHDATVATMSAGVASDLGSIDWHEENVSSLSEMLVSLSDSLKADKGLLDEQIATAFLTGIVAATDRFSNNRTSSRVMTMAAQLMAAGANQQLIAAKLEDANEISGNQTPPASDTSGDRDQHADGTTDLSEGESTKVNRSESANESQPKNNDGSLNITHEPEAADPVDQVAIETAKRRQEEAARVAEENLAAQLPTVVPMAAPVLDLHKDIAAEAAVQAVEQTDYPKIITQPISPLRTPVDDDEEQGSAQTPIMGGTLNATTEQAAEEKRLAVEEDRNRTILTHSNGDYVGEGTGPSFQPPLNAASMPQTEAPTADIFSALSTPPRPLAQPQAAPQPQPEEPQPQPQTPPSVVDVAMEYEESTPPSFSQKPENFVSLEDIDKQNRQPHEEARAAVEAAFGAIPYTPPSAEQATEAPVAPQMPPELPPLPDFSTLPPLPPLSSAPAPAQDAAGPLPPEKLGDMFGPAPQPAPQQQPPASNDPKQFKIPGQQ